MESLFTPVQNFDESIDSNTMDIFSYMLRRNIRENNQKVIIEDFDDSNDDVIQIETYDEKENVDSIDNYIITYFHNLMRIKINNLIKFVTITESIEPLKLFRLYDYAKSKNNYIFSPIDIIRNHDSNLIKIVNGLDRFLVAKKLYENDGIISDVFFFLHNAKNTEEALNIELELSNLHMNNISYENIEKFDINKLIDDIKFLYPKIFSDNMQHSKYKINEQILKSKLQILNDIKYDNKYVINKLINFNQIIRNNFIKKEKTKDEKKLFDIISIRHQFYCLMFNNYEWINQFQKFINSK